MTRYVSETNAGKSISAFVVMKGARQVATIQAHYGNSQVMVDAFQHGKPAERSAATLKKPVGSVSCQHGRASGYGYDKFTAALSDLVIDGHVLTDHCSGRKPTPKAGGWPRDAKAPKGWSFANWNRETNLYGDCYRDSGLKYLEAIGYNVIQAI